MSKKDKTSDTPEEEKKKKNWIGFFLKFTFFVLAIGLVMLTALANMGGSSDILKQSVEGFVADATGYRTEVEKFNEMQFFPNITISVEDMKLYDPIQGDAPVASVDKAFIKMSFWDVMFSTGKVKAFNIEDAVFNKGAFAPYPFKVEHARIFDDEDDKASFEMKGFLKSLPYELKADMKSYGKAPNKKYRFGDKRDIRFNLGDLNVTGSLETNKFEGFEIQDALVSFDQDILKGSLSFQDRGYGNFKITGDVHLVEHGTRISPNVILILEEMPPEIEGNIKFSELHVEDFKDQTRLKALSDFLDETFGEGQSETPDELDLSFANWDLSIDIEKLFLQKIDVGNAVLVSQNKAGNLVVQSKSAALGGGQARFDMELDTKKEEPDLSLKFAIDQIAYGDLREKLSGQAAEIHGSADFTIDVTSAGQSYDALLENMQGEARILAGQGKLQSNMINQWGGGLFGMLVPDFDQDSELEMNCAVMQAPIEDGVAKVETLFLDTKRVTVVGDGEYNIANDNLDIRLKPESKGIVVGDIAPGVRLENSIIKPDVNVSTIDLGFSIGELLLGTINPVFAAVTLTDLGITENHPCAKFFDDSSEASDEGASETQN